MAVRLAALLLLAAACVTAADLRRWEGALREAGQPEAADEVARDAAETERAERAGIGALEIALGMLGAGGLGAAAMRRRRRPTA